MNFFEFLVKFSFSAFIGYIAFMCSIYFQQEKCGYRVGDKYILCRSQKAEFERDGLSILTGILTEPEMLELEKVYMEYMREGSADKQGE